MNAMLPPEEAELFYRLYHSLMFDVNRQLQVVPNVENYDDFSLLSPETRLEVRNAFLERPDLFEPFVEENPARLSDEELQIVRSWRHHVAGRFFIFRYLKTHTVFLSGEEPPLAYGVQALTEPFQDLVGPHLPVWTETVLLPFRDKIVYDGLLNTFEISFGGGIKRNLNENYKQAKERMGGIVTALPAEPKPVTRIGPQKKSTRTSKSSSSEEVRPILELIVGMTDTFCRENLNDEYALLCRKLAEKLARKRLSPLLRGKPMTWASGIVRTIGWVNFLHDPHQTPHMRLMDIDECFGIAESTGAAKLKEIRTMLRIHQLDPGWTLPSRMDDNPLVWTLEVNGVLMDVRHAPREVQEIAFQKGLIPYVPADQD